MKNVWKYKDPSKGFKANLEAIYQLSTTEDMKHGGRWYPDAERSVGVLAERYDIEPWRVAGVVAALSPSCAWGINLEFAERLISGYVAGGDVLEPSFKAGTYGLRNKTIALNYLTCDSAFNFTKPQLGPKTGSFYCNLLGDLSAVTVDGHMYAIMVGDENAPTQDIYSLHGRLTHKRYKVLANAVIDVAQSNGMTPAALQAIVWITWRRLKDENPKLKQGYRSNEVPF